jgi:hypothetical protein
MEQRIWTPPVPAFEQASGSTEIGCGSHEVFFGTTTEETENYLSTSTEVSIISALITTVISVQCRFPLFRINYALSSQPTSNCYTSPQGSTIVTITVSFTSTLATAIISS